MPTSHTDDFTDQLTKIHKELHEQVNNDETKEPLRRKLREVRDHIQKIRKASGSKQKCSILALPETVQKINQKTTDNEAKAHIEAKILPRIERLALQISTKDELICQSPKRMRRM